MNTKRLLHISLAMILIPVLFGAGYFFAGHFFDNERDRMMQYAEDCDLARGPCMLKDAELSVELEFEGSLRTGEPLIVYVTPDRELDYVTSDSSRPTRARSQVRVQQSMIRLWVSGKTR